jgi:sideroflexin-1/3
LLISFLAKNIVENYRHGIIARPGMTFDELWGAKYLYDSAFHPDTKEKMFILGRMSAQGYQRRRFSIVASR